MAEYEENTFIRRIHDAGSAFVLVVTGGGSLAISRLLTVPGASRTVLEAAVPYSAAAMRDWLRTTPEQFCAPAAARLMAMAAYGRAVKYANSQGASSTRLMGVGCTASLASDRPKRGAHRLHVARQSVDATATYSLELLKGRRSRHEEERLAAALVLRVIADGIELDGSPSVELLEGESILTRTTIAPSEWQWLLAGHGTPVRIGPPETKPPILLPGAFHPLHEGHRRIASHASRRLGGQVGFELSIQNVDKPPLDFTEIEDRVAQFSADEGLWLTAAPTFVEKARLFPGATFVVGLDTMARIAEERYYHDSSAARDVAVAELVQCRCRFLVFGRLVEGRFQSLDDCPLPPPLRSICEGVPEGEFRLDLSSTELRRANLSADS